MGDFLGYTVLMSNAYETIAFGALLSPDQTSKFITEFCPDDGFPLDLFTPQSATLVLEVQAANLMFCVKCCKQLIDIEGLPVIATPPTSLGARPNTGDGEIKDNQVHLEDELIRLEAELNKTTQEIESLTKEAGALTTRGDNGTTTTQSKGSPSMTQAEESHIPSQTYDSEYMDKVRQQIDQLRRTQNRPTVIELSDNEDELEEDSSPIEDPNSVGSLLFNHAKALVEAERNRLYDHMISLQENPYYLHVMLLQTLEHDSRFNAQDVAPSASESMNENSVDGKISKKEKRQKRRAQLANSALLSLITDAIDDYLSVAGLESVVRQLVVEAPKIEHDLAANHDDNWTDDAWLVELCMASLIGLWRDVSKHFPQNPDPFLLVDEVRHKAEKEKEEEKDGEENPEKERTEEDIAEEKKLSLEERVGYLLSNMHRSTFVILLGPRHISNYIKHQMGALGRLGSTKCSSWHMALNDRISLLAEVEWQIMRWDFFKIGGRMNELRSYLVLGEALVNKEAGEMQEKGTPLTTGEVEEKCNRRPNFVKEWFQPFDDAKTRTLDFDNDALAFFRAPVAYPALSEPPTKEETEQRITAEEQLDKIWEQFRAHVMLEQIWATMPFKTHPLERTKAFQDPQPSQSAQSSGSPLEQSPRTPPQTDTAIHKESYTTLPKPNEGSYKTPPRIHKQSFKTPQSRPKIGFIHAGDPSPNRTRIIQMQVNKKRKNKTLGTARPPPLILPVAELAPAEVPPMRIKLKKRHFETMQTMYKVDGARQVIWKEFLKAMSEIGFSVGTAGGSERWFDPGSEIDSGVRGLTQKITFHDPHGVRIPPEWASKMVFRLKNTYNWDADTFELLIPENRARTSQNANLDQASGARTGDDNDLQDDVPNKEDDQDEEMDFDEYQDDANHLDDKIYPESDHSSPKRKRAVEDDDDDDFGSPRKTQYTGKGKGRAR